MSKITGSPNCYEFLVNCANGTDFDAVIQDEQTIKFSRLLKDIDSTADFLYAKGIRCGDCFTIFLPNCTQCFVAFYALNKIGAIANIVHPRTPPEVLRSTMEVTRSKGIFISDSLAVKYAKMLSHTDSLCIFCSDSDYATGFGHTAIRVKEIAKFRGLGHLQGKNGYRYSTVISSEAFEEIPRSDGSNVAAYLHGGGTTGESKTIKLSSNALNSLVEKIRKLDTGFHNGNECSLITLPMFHAYGLDVALHFSLCNGFCCIPVPHFSADEVIRHIKKRNVTFMVGVPNMYRKIWEHKDFDGKHLAKLRLLFCGGDLVSEQLLMDFNKTLKKNNSSGKLMRGYGLTEVCSVCCTNTPANTKPNSIGKPLDGITMEIWDNNKQRLPVNTVGEIAVKSSTLMEGYLTWQDLPNEGIYIDPQGGKWVLTGDLGYIDEDGYMFFTGRKKRLIIISGHNVYPTDIENEVMSLPYVKEACVVEAFSNNKPFIKLFVSLNSTRQGAAVEAIKKYCSENLPLYYSPREVVVLPELPRTQLGKIDIIKLH